MTTLVIIVHIVSALVVMYASFCRLSKTDHETFPLVRTGIWLLFSVSAVSVVALLVWGWRPDMMHAAIFGAIAVAQISTRHQWQHGVPQWFQRTHIWH